MSLQSFTNWIGRHKKNNGPNIVVHSAFGPMIINTNDKFIGSEIKSSGVWQAGEIQLLLRMAEFLIEQNGPILVYDIGANIGQHSLALATKFRGRIAIRAFEPQPPIFHMLCGTMALNNIQDINCECALVGDKNGISVDVRLPDYDAKNNFGGFEFERARYSDNENMTLGIRQANVRCVTVDSFDEHVHLMKIDAEGMEEFVLNGARAVILKSRPICYVETSKTGADPIKKFFDSLEYKFFARGDNALAVPNEWLRNISFLKFFQT